jgi:hypothetical protein
VTNGVLGKYAKLVSSASEGAVTRSAATTTLASRSSEGPVTR